VFDIAFSELVVIGIVMLVVIGPKRLPEVARSAGRWMGRIRRFVEDVKRDMDVELRKDELAELRKVKEQLTETKQLIEQTAGSTFASLASIQPAGESVSGNAAAMPALPPEAAATGPARKAGSRKKKAAPRKTRMTKSTTHGRARRKRR